MIFTVVLQVNGRTGAIILAHGVNGLGCAHAAVFAGNRGIGGLGLHHIRIAFEHLFGHRRRLDQKEPVLVSSRRSLCNCALELGSRDNVEHGHFPDIVGVVEREAVRHAAATVVTRHVEPVTVRHARGPQL